MEILRGTGTQFEAILIVSIRWNANSSVFGVENMATEKLIIAKTTHSKKVCLARTHNGMKDPTSLIIITMVVSKEKKRK